MHLRAVAGHFRTCGTAQGTLTDEGCRREMEVHIFVIVTNVFISVTKAIAIFVLIMGTSMILIMKPMQRKLKKTWVKILDLHWEAVKRKAKCHGVDKWMRYWRWVPCKTRCFSRLVVSKWNVVQYLLQWYPMTVMLFWTRKPLSLWQDTSSVINKCTHLATPNEQVRENIKDNDKINVLFMWRKKRMKENGWQCFSLSAFISKVWVKHSLLLIE